MLCSSELFWLYFESVKILSPLEITVHPLPTRLRPAVSGNVPDDPVVSTKSGLVFEKRLVERVLEVGRWEADPGNSRFHTPTTVMD
jgi:hypothetical protein